MPDALSIYQRINACASAHKQAAWASYSPLTLEQLGKEHHTHDKVTERETDEAIVAHRITETLAIKHALGWFQFMSEDPVIRLEPVLRLRYCAICRKYHAIDAFERDRRYPSGVAFASKSCRQTAGKYFYRRVESGKARVGAVGT